MVTQRRHTIRQALACLSPVNHLCHSVICSSFQTESQGWAPGWAAVVRQVAAGKGGVLVASPRVLLGILNPRCRKLRALCWRFSISIAFPKLKVFPTCSFYGFLMKSDTNATVSNSCPETVHLQLGCRVFIWRTFHQPPVSPLPL